MCVRAIINHGMKFLSCFHVESVDKKYVDYSVSWLEKLLGQEQFFPIYIHMYLLSYLHFEGGDSNLSRRFWSMNNKRASEVLYFMSLCDCGQKYIRIYENESQPTIPSLYFCLSQSHSLNLDPTPETVPHSHTHARAHIHTHTHTHTHKIGGVGFQEYSSTFLINFFKINYFHIHLRVCARARARVCVCVCVGLTLRFELGLRA